MTTLDPGTDTEVDPCPPAPPHVERRLDLDFDGDLDEVPLDAAVTLTDVAGRLLAHGDRHRGRPATLRVVRLGALLNLWLDDPECSPSCLGAAGCVPLVPDDGSRSPGETRVRVDDGPEGGVRLHWMLLLGDRAEDTVAPGDVHRLAG